jgi:hypothetical protein
MATPRTFKEFIQQFQSICESQLAIKQFQLGEPSDLDVENDEHTFQRFPLAFLIPDISEMDRYGKMSLGFTFVVADIVRNEEDWQIDTYNSTLMIMQDVMSKIVMTPASDVDFTVQTPIVIDPFVERYNNNLAGWSAALTIDIKSPFNLCDAAF